MKITFENDTEKQGSWKWHYGSVESDVKEFPFSVCEMYEPTSGTSSFEYYLISKKNLSKDLVVTI